MAILKIYMESYERCLYIHKELEVLKTKKLPKYRKSGAIVMWRQYQKVDPYKHRNPKMPNYSFWKFGTKPLRYRNMGDIPKNNPKLKIFFKELNHTLRTRNVILYLYLFL